MNQIEQTLIITEGLLELPEDQSLSYIIERALFEIFDDEPDRKLVRQVNQQYKDMIEKFVKLLRKSRGLPTEGSEYAKLSDQLEELKVQIDSHERDFHSILDLKKYWKRTKDPIIAKKYKIAMGVALFALILAGIAYKIYCGKIDKCGKFEGKDYRKCRINAAEAVIKELKLKMKECSGSKNPEKCREKIQNEIEKWEVKRRKEMLIYKVLK